MTVSSGEKSRSYSIRYTGIVMLLELKGIVRLRGVSESKLGSGAELSNETADTENSDAPSFDKPKERAF